MTKRDFQGSSSMDMDDGKFLTSREGRFQEESVHDEGTEWGEEWGGSAWGTQSVHGQ